MAISLQSLLRSGTAYPPRLLVYGVAGVGKTKLAANAPNPIFLQTEDGLGMIQAATFGLMRSYADIQDALDVLFTQQHDFQTVVLDSLDWLEPLIWQETARINNWGHIEQAGFGKGGLTPYRPGVKQEEVANYTLETIATAVGGEKNLMVVGFDPDIRKDAEAFPARWKQALKR